jgi:L-serine/L-threonine ammonia-lyase
MTLPLSDSDDQIPVHQAPTHPQPDPNPPPSSSFHSRCVHDADKLLQWGLYRHTPLIYSPSLSRLFRNRSVFLKLDSLQPSGSYKDRGMSYLCHHLKSTQNITNVVSSSGGNAGLAVATVGSALGMSVSVIVPETTKLFIVEKLQALGATVTVHGENWNAADTMARQIVQAHADTTAYISPYDHPLLWTGHSTIIDEIVADLPTINKHLSVISSKANINGVSNQVDQQHHQQHQQPPKLLPEGTTIVASVGGGGLMCGILEGLIRHQQNSHVQVMAVETEGASSFGTAWRTGDGSTPVRLDAITSIATSLGALSVTPVVLERASQYNNDDVTPHTFKFNQPRFVSAICTDREAVDACLQLARDHRILVEPACGAALAILYQERLREQFLSEARSTTPGGPIVVEICGGSGVTVELLQEWESKFCSH